VFDHVTIRVADRAASERFYATVLPALGIAQTTSEADVAEWDVFSLATATAERPPTRRLHIGFTAPSREAVDRFWRAGREAGHPDDGAPGPRPQYAEGYYGGFLLDPDGNSAEAVHLPGADAPVVDHLWIRVAAVAAARDFYATVAPYIGFSLRREDPDRVQFAGERGASFSLVAGAPTERVHLAFPARDDAAVRAFHTAATRAGYRDDGAPGERPAYHPGSYAAYVLDPDGNNVELVARHRGEAGLRP